MPVIKNEYQGRKPDEFRILLGLEGHPDSRNIKTYIEKSNGYKALEKILKGGMSSGFKGLPGKT